MAHEIPDRPAQRAPRPPAPPASIQPFSRPKPSGIISPCASWSFSSMWKRSGISVSSMSANTPRADFSIHFAPPDRIAAPFPFRAPRRLPPEAKFDPPFRGFRAVSRGRQRHAAGHGGDCLLPVAGYLAYARRSHLPSFRHTVLLSAGPAPEFRLSHRNPGPVDVRSKPGRALPQRHQFLSRSQPRRHTPAFPPIVNARVVAPDDHPGMKRHEPVVQSHKAPAITGSRYGSPLPSLYDIRSASGPAFRISAASAPAHAATPPLPETHSGEPDSGHSMRFH